MRIVLVIFSLLTAAGLVDRLAFRGFYVGMVLSGAKTYATNLYQHFRPPPRSRD